VFFTSSTVVYAQSAGEWVDEASPTEPVHFAGTRMLEAERLLLRAPFPATVLRLGGIYGPGRIGLIERIRRGEVVCAPGPPVYTNRIHRDDCAGVLRHLMIVPGAERIYIGVDHEPAEECTVARWLAARLGAPAPRGVLGADRGVRRHRGPPRPRRRAGNKRCRNAKLLGTGYVFRYPTFREGYGALLSDIET
jgi:nucleoside-diphosphate-sugar epimerase